MDLQVTSCRSVETKLYTSKGTAAVARLTRYRNKLIQAIAAYLILSTGARYHELGAQYMQAKIEKKRKLYLTAELKKLGYKVSLEKKRKQQNPETTLS